MQQSSIKINKLNKNRSFEEDACVLEVRKIRRELSKQPINLKDINRLGEEFLLE